MKRELKMKWALALASGRYKQTSGFLEYDGALCCLGVLCKVARIPIDEAREAQMLSRDTLKKLGLTEHRQIELQHMNDHGKSFREIADWIVRH